MANIHVAYTEPVNPAGESPTLTVEQLWTGAKRGARRGQDFIKIVTETEVLEDSDTRIKRRLHLDGSVPFLPKESVEIVTLYPPVKMEFLDEEGQQVECVISVGPKGAEAGDIYLTVTVRRQYPEIQAGSAEEEQRRQAFLQVAQMSVRSIIVTMRQLVTDGQLENY